MGLKRGQLSYWFQPIDVIFRNFKRDCLDYDNPDQRRIFIDNGGSVLFVAHLDTVVEPCLLRQTGTRWLGAGFDDRLGAFAAYKNALGLGADLLLTDLEESAGTTAEFHDCKQYNWVCEFDRCGQDVVTYGQDNSAFIQELMTEWKIGWGSFSDICNLPTRACCMNIGIGYEHAHSVNSYFDINVFNEQMKKFKRFYESHKDIQYIADKTNSQYSWSNYARDYNYDSYDRDFGYSMGRGYVKPTHGNKQDDFYSIKQRNFPEDTGVCDVCGVMEGVLVHGCYVCQGCFSGMMNNSPGLHNIDGSLVKCDECFSFHPASVMEYSEIFDLVLCQVCNDEMLSRLE